MKVDLTITVTAILGIAAIISPIATAIINNLYQLKLKRIELQQKHLENTTYYIRSIFENYLRYAGRCIYNSDRDASKDYGEYYFLALSYAPDEMTDLLISINNCIYNDRFDEATQQLEQLKPKISVLLQQL